MEQGREEVVKAGYFVFGWKSLIGWLEQQSVLLCEMPLCISIYINMHECLGLGGAGSIVSLSLTPPLSNNDCMSGEMRDITLSPMSMLCMSLQVCAKEKNGRDVTIHFIIQ